MKKRYLIGLVAVCLAVIAVVYVARNGGTPENELPPAAAERHGHGRAVADPSKALPSKGRLASRTKAGSSCGSPAGARTGT